MAFNNYNRNNRNRNNQNFVPQSKKYSGVKSGIAQDSKGVKRRWINGWYVSKNTGLLKISAFENSKSTRYQGSTGKKHVTIMFEVFYQNSGNKVLELTSFHEDSQTAVLEKVGLFIDVKKGRITKIVKR